VLHTSQRTPPLRAYLGNGLLATQLMADGALAGTHPAPLHLMAGLYDRAAGKEVEHPVPLPAWSTLRLKAGEQILHPHQAQGYTQTLDLRRGVAETQHNWTLSDGGLQVAVLQAVLRHEPHLDLIQMRLLADHPCVVEVSAPLDAAGGPALRESRVGTHGGYIWTEARTLERDRGLAVAGTLITDGQAAQLEPGLAMVQVALRPGQVETVSWLVAVHNSYTAPEPRDAALADLERACTTGVPGLLAGHAAAWAALWQTDIVVEGDLETQRFVRAALFALLCSLRAGVEASVAPMGISSLMYNGHIFWDADTWMFPPLLLLHPEIAQGIVAYRQARLPAAQARARMEGYQGAMFPWESATEGEETTPISIARTGLKEHHITACVALAQWQYYLATHDRAWLATRGWPVLEAAAAFWTSRVTPTPAGFAIHDVICADEYAEDVDNNAFTNAAARAALLAAIAAANALGRTPPSTWQQVADGLILVRNGDLILEYDGYDGRTIKQADVELLTYPLEYPLPESSIIRNLETYRRATDPEGPAMSRSISAIVAAQLGRRAEAMALFSACYQPHLYGPFYALAETRSNGQVSFLTGVGGALQVLLFGFAGLRMHQDALTLDPLLPAGWGKLHIRSMHWRGLLLDITVAAEDRAILGLHDKNWSVVLGLRRWRPGTEPLTVDWLGVTDGTTALDAAGWRVEEVTDGAGWRLWPLLGEPDRPFVSLRLTTHRANGQSFTIALEQRVRNGDS
jgi:trehalose/maltose hydrolase-like predicted phosphorylase